MRLRSKPLAKLMCLGLVAQAVLACGGTKVIQLHPKVVLVHERGEDLPFDGPSARLTSAADQLAQLAGQRVEIELDPAFFAGSRDTFQEALGQALENLARDLDSSAKRGLSLEGPVQLARVELRYAAGADRDEIELDSAKKILRITGAARSGALVKPGELAWQLERAREGQLTDRFATAKVEKVAPADRRAYFTALRRGVGKPTGASREPLADSWEAQRMQSMLRLSELSGADHELGAELNAWLLGEISWFTQAYVHRASEVERAGPDSAFRRAERAFGAWMLQAFTHASEQDQLRIAQALLPVYALDRELWPGVDRFAFALRVTDTWRAQGHRPADHKELSPAQGHVVCVRSRTASGAHTRARCDDGFVRWVLGDEARRQKLAKALRDRNDAVWAEQIFMAVAAHDGKERAQMMALLREVEPSVVVWTAGMRVLADRSMQSKDRLLLEEAQRLWLRYPSAQRRGAVLFLLTHIDYYGHGNVDWGGFELAFGGRITAAELQSYLGQGLYVALPRARLLWPALGKFDRARVLEPALAAYLDAAGGSNPVLLREQPRPYDLLNELFGVMCEHKNSAELGVLGAMLERRSKSHPGEPYASFAEYADRRECKVGAPGKAKAVRNEVRLVPARGRGITPLAEEER